MVTGVRNPLPDNLSIGAKHGPLPLVVGVTGHRDLRRSDISRLEELVAAVFTDTCETYPHTPLLLLSPLAEGADQLVARVARSAGVGLVVPLPLPRNIYETDFESDDSGEAFEQLLSSADGVFELPLFRGNTPQSIEDAGEPRDRQYAQVGAYIAQHSQILLALWDGVQSVGESPIGGTADVVRFRLDGVPLAYDSAAHPFNAASNGAVCHIVTPRHSKPEPDHTLTTRLLFPGRQNTTSVNATLRWIDKFNEDAIAQQDVLLEATHKSKVQLLRSGDTRRVEHEIDLVGDAQSTLERYAVADCLAVHFAKLARATSRRVFTLVFCAAMSFNIFHSLPHPYLSEAPTLLERTLAIPWSLVTFLVASLVASLGIHRKAYKAGYENKHQDYRALAEALRVQFFWRVAGISDNAVDYYLRKQRGPLDWIRNALYAWDVQVKDQPHHTSDDEKGARLAFVAERWVAEQQEYYGSRARREQAEQERAEKQIRWFALLSVGLASVLAFFLTAPLVIHAVALEAIKHAVETPWTHGTIMLFIVGLAVTAGLLHGYNQQMARAEHTRQSTRMSDLFGNARQHLIELLRSDDHEQATLLLKELGREALEENGDWVLLHRDRPLEVPHSG